MSLPSRVLQYGVDAPLPEVVSLRAGRLSLEYEAGTLRHFRAGDALALAHIYPSVRDQYWNTAPAQITLLEQTIAADHFRLRFEAEHALGDVRFVWHATVTGTPDHTVTFALDGEAQSDFLRNRIGFCVLHSSACAGQPVRVEHTDGRTEEGQFPHRVSADKVFADVRAMTHLLAPGVSVEVRMEGETFETEDQRNWSDGSFKTYCTPVAMPRPVKVQAGDRVVQQVTVRLIGEPEALAALSAHAAGSIRMRLGDELRPTLRPKLPPLGLCMASHDQALNETEISLLRALRIAFLRADLHLWKRDQLAARLQRAIDAATALDVTLALAIHLGGEAGDPALSDGWHAQLAALAEIVAAKRPPVIRWLVFAQSARATPPDALQIAREALAALAPNATFVGGTDGNFVEINRDRAFLAEADGVVYSTNPQVHLPDNTTLLETLPALAEMVETARQAFGAKPLHVGPVTLRRRVNLEAPPETQITPPDTLPDSVDVRQMSLFGAGWLVGTLGALGGSPIDSLTLGETTGWRGLIEHAAGAPLPKQFQSIPGGVYPMWHILRAWAEFQEGAIWGLDISAPTRAAGFALRKGHRLRIVLANLTPMPQEAIFEDWAEDAQTRFIVPENAALLMADPDLFERMTLTLFPVRHGSLTMGLPPFGVAVLDTERGD